MVLSAFTESSLSSSSSSSSKSVDDRVGVSLFSSVDPDLVRREKSFRLVISLFGLFFTLDPDADVAAVATAAAAAESPEVGTEMHFLNERKQV